MPYFCWEFNQYRFNASCIHIWTSVCVGINIAFPTQDKNAVSLIYFFVLPLVVFAGYVALNLRKLYLKGCDTNELTNCYEVESIYSLLLYIFEYCSQRSYSFRRCYKVFA